MKHFTCFLFLTLVSPLFLSAQTATGDIRRPGEILIQLEPGTTLQWALDALSRNHGALQFSFGKTLAEDWGIHLIRFDETEENAATALALVNRSPGIHFAQWNSRVEERGLEPNDTDWWKQNDMKLINAPEAWEASVGGLTHNGDTIVVAVLEKGALMTHPDLAPNRWWNWNEIPDNDIDDDGNGFVDDVSGFNPQTQASDLGNKSPHGTGVHGIIGAVGNNLMGVSGVNWKVKLMPIHGIDFESDIIEGYNYVARMRKVYNQTNGAKGAFVVATNASFGFDNWRAEDHKLWCAVYDSLGKIGVLSTGATANNNVDVDEVGDMPTTCGSEFLITVTNILPSGSRALNAAYGSVSIDLGAPGDGSHSTSNNGDTPTYAIINSCSAATPHVTGGIALLYSLGCEPFTSDALSDPVTCARRVRDAILNSAEPNTSLAGKTTTGGHLDLGNALESVREICKGAKVGPLDLVQVRTYQTAEKLRVYYQTPVFQPYNFRVFNMLGQLMFEKSVTPLQFSENYVDVETTNWPRGVYVMAIGRGSVVKARKFTKI